MLLTLEYDARCGLQTKNLQDIQYRCNCVIAREYTLILADNVSTTAYS